MSFIDFLIGINRDFKGGNLFALIDYISYFKYDLSLKPFGTWVNFYEYCRFYSTLNYKNKVVVDYGADIGSSAIYFLSKGAKQVIGIEIDKKAVDTSKKLSFNEFNFKIKFTYTLKKHPKGDILKMDIEGAEKDILTEEYLKGFKQFVIGLHPHAYSVYTFNTLENLLIRHGGKKYGMVKNESNTESEIIYIKK
jgi:ribosomal protein L21E